MRYSFWAIKREKYIWIAVWIVLVLVQGCAYHRPLPEEPFLNAYVAQGPEPSEAVRWAPVFIVHEYAERYNRIGRPTVRQEADKSQEVFVDPEYPTIYFMQRQFTTQRGSYTNLIYRIHFPEIPFSLIPFNLSAGDNVGLMTVITLDGKGHPVLVSTVHTCGCYKAIVPTNYLPQDAFPKDWTGRPLAVYGERLPAVLDFGQTPSPLLLIHLRPEVHRVMDIEIIPAEQLSSDRYHRFWMKMEAMDVLNRLPADDGTASFYYQKGLLKGHVKGAIKPWETLLMSWISMDLFVGMDKAYADPAVSGNPFYTSLKPWRRSDSNMWDFRRFLHYWGWRL